MKISKEAKIGLFVVLIIAAIFILINFLRGNGFLKRSNDYYSSYENVEGLNPSTPVYIQGFKAGSVVAIKYNKKKANYVIKINMKGEFDIPQDSRTEIYSSDILGGKAIRVVYGESKLLAKSGDTLRGSSQPDMLSQLINGVIPIKDQINVLINNLNEAITNINDILNESNKKEVAEILSGIRKSVDNIEYISSALKTNSPELSGIIVNLNTLTEQLKSSVTKLDVTLDNAAAISQELKEAELKETINNLKTLIEKLQDPSGSLGKLMKTDSLHNSINNLTNDLDSLVKKIEANPKKYMKISVF